MPAFPARPNVGWIGPDEQGSAEPITSANAAHYTWGSDCDGWRLVDAAGLSVIEERMPPDTAEDWHTHDFAQQFFYVLDGQAIMRTPAGAVVLPARSGFRVAPGTPHLITNAGTQDLRFLVVSTPSTRGDRRTAVPDKEGQGTTLDDQR